jgi:osmotically inducible lipoprotein OsmB
MSELTFGDLAMTSTLRLAAVTLAAAGTLSLGACGSMDHRERSTATGAAIGGVAGAVLGNSPAATVGGAVVGGVVGNQVGKEREQRDR